MFCWTEHPTVGPELGQWNAYVPVSVQHKVYSIGAIYNNKIDVWLFNTVSLHQRRLIPVTTGGDGPHLDSVPPALVGYSAVLVEDAIYLWGGQLHRTLEYCNVLYVFDVNTHRWSKPRVSGTFPDERANHSACVLGKVMFIHGGFTKRDNWYRELNDMHKLDTTTMVWSVITTRGTSPPLSQGHSATVIGTKIFVFGGKAHTGFSPQDNRVFRVRVFDTRTNVWLYPSSTGLLPLKYNSHSACAYNGELYLLFYGFLEAWNLSNELWKFNPESFSWKKVPKPKSKGRGPMVYRPGCMVGDRIIFFSQRGSIFVLHLRPSLKTLCKLEVIRYGLDQSELPHNVRCGNT